MKLLTPLLLAFAANALQLPLQLQSHANALRSKIDAYRARLPSVVSLSGLELPRLLEMEVPQFLKNLADPVAASPVLALHRSLVQIPSITGNERPVADWLVAYLVAHNLTVETQVVAGDRVNVLAYPGTTRATHTLLTSHLDTVPPHHPYRTAGGMIAGRGSADAKASVAAQTTAALELLAEGSVHEGDLALLFVVGEEHDGAGMRAANALGLAWQAVIFGEPTENRLAVGHKGILQFAVLATGTAAHSGYPQLGVSAVSRLVRALAALDALALPHSPLLGPSTLNIGLIAGGVAANVVAAAANASVTVRVADDLTAIKAAVRDAVATVPGVSLAPPSVAYGAVELDHDVPGFDTVVCAYGTDVPNLAGSHKKYLYGPGSSVSPPSPLCLGCS